MRFSSFRPAPSPLLSFQRVSICDLCRFSYPPEATVLLAPDSDCCKIFTDTQCELLQRVPLASEAISRIGSTDPAAMLFDASTAFEEGDPRADEASNDRPLLFPRCCSRLSLRRSLSPSVYMSFSLFSCILLRFLFLFLCLFCIRALVRFNPKLSNICILSSVRYLIASRRRCDIPNHGSWRPSVIYRGYFLTAMCRCAVL